jgi:hypothetical protein
MDVAGIQEIAADKSDAGQGAGRAADEVSPGGHVAVPS